jgi:hypothetical protein
MARTESHKRYAKRHLVGLGFHGIRREERDALRLLKRAQGITWLEALYRGLGARREDVLNSLKKRGERDSR